MADGGMLPQVLLYGHPPPALFPEPAGAIQVSPLHPGGRDLSEPPGLAFGSALIVAPPGRLEREWVLARVLQILPPGAPITALAPNDRGGPRIAPALRTFGCRVTDEPKRRNRICRTLRPETPAGLEGALEAGGARLHSGLGLWTQPGVFSWDRKDPGTVLLLDVLPPLEGRGADFGCGVGVIALHVLGRPGVTAIELWDIDRRAIACAQRNVTDGRAAFHHGDIRRMSAGEGDLDFVVMNPPFHDGGREDRALGAAFIAAAGRRLRPGGRCWITANRHLPYEAPLAAAFREVRPRAEAGGFKVYEAIR
ncbi:MAG: class I SAM-dependent methyltransferase [Phenylobacterium sp.]